MKPFIGIDIGGTKCAVTLARADRGIRFIGKKRFDSRAWEGPEEMFERICASADELLAENGLSCGGIQAVGVSCGGPLDSSKGVVLCPPNLPGWVNIPITKKLEKRFGVPAFLLNDANACALAEWKLGAGRGCRNMIFLTMGTGMGGGVIAEGRLLVGASDMGGEIGHLRLAEDGPVGFGKAGSFEGFCSGGGIARQAQEYTRRALEQGRAPAWTRDSVNTEEINAGLIAGYAKKGDADAIAIYETVGRWLGKGLSLLTDAFNPERIVIGSIFARSGELLSGPMYKEMQKECIPYSLNAVQVVPAALGESLGDCAAIMTALNALGIDPMYEAEETDERVLFHYGRIFERYPRLSGLKQSVMDAYLALRDCFEGGGKLLLCGNGGSCADAEHIAGELMKGFYLKRPVSSEEPLSRLQGALCAVPLTGSGALATAFMNDVSPEYVFAQQVLGLGRRGDVLLAISTSGNAKNVLAAVKTAKALGIGTVALTGGTGGRLAEECGLHIIAPGNSPADVQECHLPIYHTLCAMLEAHFYKE